MSFDNKMDSYIKIPLPGASNPADTPQNLQPTPGSSSDVYTAVNNTIKMASCTQDNFKTILMPSQKGVENAKKRLRAFSIQKKNPLKSPLTLPKPATSSGSTTTVLIGKLNSVKTTPKPQPIDEEKRPPKPPKPGTHRRLLQDSYEELQKKTLSEIEDMKRKMELVELGIPLGLICPTASEGPGSVKAMPTKAMPPIKTFLDSAKVDEIIREAKKTKAEGKEFKFDYRKLLPGYDNPFQRKYSDDKSTKEKKGYRSTKEDKFTDKHRDDKYGKRRSDKYDRHFDYKKDDRDKHKVIKERDRTDRSKEKHVKNKPVEEEVKETNVNLNDYLVCDSWSLDNDEKSTSNPKVEEKVPQKEKIEEKPTEIIQEQQVCSAIAKNPDLRKNLDKDKEDSPKPKMEKLKPVVDSFAFEIDVDEDEVIEDSLTIFGEDTDIKSDTQKPLQLYDYDLDISKDDIDDTFLESVINEIKQEDMSEDSQEKALVEYDPSPKDDERESVTPELDDSVRDLSSQRSDYSDYKSIDSGVKSSESGYRSDSHRSSSYRLSMEKEVEGLVGDMSKETLDSLETWSFVLKICQPLLFRHDKDVCYKSTHTAPKLWFVENPKLCSCVEDRTVVYEELEMCKMSLVDRVYGCDQISDSAFPKTRTWYPRINSCLTECSMVHLSSDWEADDSQTEQTAAKNGKEKRKSTTPQVDEELKLDREYQRFIDAVWPEVSDTKTKSAEVRSTTPTRDVRKKRDESEGKKKKRKLSPEDWSQDSEADVEKSKKLKLEKRKEKARKRKHSTSTSTLTSISEDEDVKKRRKIKKNSKKLKSKLEKRRRIKRKQLKKLKERRKRKKMLESEANEKEKEKRKALKKSKKKRLQKLKKKIYKKKKVKSSSSDSSSSSLSSSESATDDSDKKSKKRKEERKKKRDKRRKQSTESSESEDLFDVNILNNIKTEKLDEDNSRKKMIEDFSPRRQQRSTREIINVKELQNDLVNIHIKQEIVDGSEISTQVNVSSHNNDEQGDEKRQGNDDEHQDKETCQVSEETDGSKTIENLETDYNEVISVESQEQEKPQFKEPQDIPLPQPIRAIVDESNLSQCSSQESIISFKDQPTYEKDDSHLRPSSQNSNYSFNDVINAKNMYQKTADVECEKYETYEENNYEMYEQMAMAYQSDVANKVIPLPSEPACQHIETVVGSGGRVAGEIKCDWRLGDPAHSTTTQRPSRWGLKPGEVNIVLTGGNTEHFPVSNVIHQPVYKIESIANRNNDNSTGYDEAYMDMYGASDRLQYGDCFADGEARRSEGLDGDVSPERAANGASVEVKSTLDERIDQALRETVLGEVAKIEENVETDKDGPEKGILVTNKPLQAPEWRGLKRVSFADGYKPGQDSDTEEPPVKKKRKHRRYGCAWPCPASHADHVPLWDALPPPPPPAHSPPPPPHRAPPLALLRAPPPRPLLPAPAHLVHKYNPVALPALMTHEPPPSLLNYQ